ncbi:hypothetical protein CCHL11_10076 [Colletotrichum chlorophyti]|uniref:Uncharacterized protein n=1 Tax=Colletotrichum chlorophyti TaxID=708187 RepID=A0A1Q8S2P0_9PEZI|nr:hypothetical protein CCHL11_10076 [Colletotrichum chlorophyti]
MDLGTGFYICNNLSYIRDVDFLVSKDILTRGGTITTIGRGDIVVKYNIGGKGSSAINVKYSTHYKHSYNDFKSYFLNIKDSVIRYIYNHWPIALGDYIVINFFTISKAYNNKKVILIIRDRWSDFI